MKIDELAAQVVNYQDRYERLEGQLAQPQSRPLSRVATSNGAGSNLPQRSAMAFETQPPSPSPATASNGAEAQVTKTREVPPVTTPDMEMKQVLATIEKWRAAWAAQDVKAYVAQYTEDFGPDNGQSRQAWLADREQKLKRPQTISIKIENIYLSRLEPQRWQVEFRQTYQSDVYRDVTTKQMTLQKVEGRYRIANERAVQPS